MGIFSKQFPYRLNKSPSIFLTQSLIYHQSFYVPTSYTTKFWRLCISLRIWFDFEHWNIGKMLATSTRSMQGFILNGFVSHLTSFIENIQIVLKFVMQEFSFKRFVWYRKLHCLSLKFYFVYIWKNCASVKYFIWWLPIGFSKVPCYMGGSAPCKWGKSFVYVDIYGSLVLCNMIMICWHIFIQFMDGFLSCVNSISYLGQFLFKPNSSSNSYSSLYCYNYTIVHIICGYYDIIICFHVKPQCSNVLYKFIVLLMIKNYRTNKKIFQRWNGFK